jgi:hypothetical protein
MIWCHRDRYCRYIDLVWRDCLPCCVQVAQPVLHRLYKLTTYKLTLGTKCTKKIFLDKDFRLNTGDPLCGKEFYFWNLHTILRLLVPKYNKSFLLRKNNFLPSCNAWSKKSWRMMKGALGKKKFFFCCFRYFGKVCKKSQGDYFWKCKKAYYQPSLL